MSDVCLYFEDLLVEIKLQYIDKNEEISDKLWYAANAAYSKLTKYYTKISSENFAIATVLDPRYKLNVYDTTQDPVALKTSAEVAIKVAFERYSLNFGLQPNNSILVTPQAKKQKRFADEDDESDANELSIYLQERRSKSGENPLDYWRLNKIRFPILAKMLGIT
jgi:hypothetical protein